MEAEVYVPHQAALLVTFIVSAHGFFWPIPDEIRPFPIADNTDYGIVGFPMLMGYHRLVDKSGQSGNAEISSELHTDQPHILSQRPKYFLGVKSVRQKYREDETWQPLTKKAVTTGESSTYKPGVSALRTINQHRPTDKPDKTSHGLGGHPDETSQTEVQRSTDKPDKTPYQSTGHQEETPHKLTGHPRETSYLPVDQPDETSHLAPDNPDNTSFSASHHPDNTSYPASDRSDYTLSPASDHPDNTSYPASNQPDNTSYPATDHADNTSYPALEHPDNTSFPATEHPDNTSYPASDHLENASHPATKHPDSTSHPGSDHSDNTSYAAPKHPDNTSYPATEHPDNTSHPRSHFSDNTSYPATKHPGHTSYPALEHQDNTSYPALDHPDSTSYPATEHPDNTSYPALDHPDNTLYPALYHPNSTSHPATEHPDNTSYPALDHPDNTSYPALDDPDSTSYPALDHPDNTSYPALDHPDSTSYPATEHPDNTSYPATEHPDNTSYPALDHPDNTSYPTLDYPENTSYAVRDRPDNTSHPQTHHSNEKSQLSTRQPFVDMESRNESDTNYRHTMPTIQQHEEITRPRNQLRASWQHPVNLTEITNWDEAKNQSENHINETFGAHVNQSDDSSGESSFSIHFTIRLSRMFNQTPNPGSSHPDQLDKKTQHKLAMDVAAVHSAKLPHLLSSSSEHLEDLEVEHLDGTSRYSITHRESVPRSLKSTEEHQQVTIEKYTTSTRSSPQHPTTSSDQSPEHNNDEARVKVRIDVQTLSNKDSPFSTDNVNIMTRHHATRKPSLQRADERLAKRMMIDFHQIPPKQSRDSSARDSPGESKKSPQHSREYTYVNSVPLVQTQTQPRDTRAREQTHRTLEQHVAIQNNQSRHVHVQAGGLLDHPKNRPAARAKVRDESFLQRLGLQHEPSKRLLPKLYINGVAHSWPLSIHYPREKKTFSAEKTVDLSQHPNRQHLNVDEMSLGQIPGRSAGDSDDTSIDRSLEHTKKNAGQVFPKNIRNLDIQPFHLVEKAGATPLQSLERLLAAASLKNDSSGVTVILQNETITHLLIKVYIYGVGITSEMSTSQQGSDQYSQGKTDNEGKDNTESTQDSLDNTDESGKNNTQSTQGSLDSTDESGKDNIESTQDSLDSTDESGKDNIESTQDSLDSTDESGKDNIESTQDSLDSTDESGKDNTDSTQDSLDSINEPGGDTSESIQDFLGNTDEAGKDNTESTQGSLDNTDEPGKNNTESTEGSLDNTDQSGEDNTESTQGSLDNTDESGKDNTESTQGSLHSTDESGKNNTQSTEGSLDNESGKDNTESTQDSVDDTDESGEDTSGSTQGSLDNTDKSGEDNTESTQDSLDNTDESGKNNTQSTEGSLDSADESGKDNTESTQGSLHSTDESGEDTSESTQDSVDNTDESGKDNTESTEGSLDSTDELGKDNTESSQDSLDSTDESGENQNGMISYLLIQVYIDGVGIASQVSLDNTDESGEDTSGSTQGSLGNTDKSGEENTESTQDSLDNTDESGKNNTQSTQGSVHSTDESGEDTSKSTQDSLDSTDESGEDNIQTTQDSVDNTDESGENQNGMISYLLIQVYIDGVGIASQGSLDNTDESREDTSGSTQGSLGNTDKSGEDNTESTQDSLDNTNESGKNNTQSTEGFLDSTDESGKGNTESTQGSLHSTDESGEDTSESTQDSVDNTDESGEDITEPSQGSLDSTDESGEDISGSTQGSLGNTDKSGEDNTESTEDSLDNTDHSSQQSSETPVIVVRIDVQTLQGNHSDVLRTQYSDEWIRYSQRDKETQNMKTYTLKLTEENGTTKYLLITVHMDGVDQILRKHHSQSESTQLQLNHTGKPETDTRRPPLHSTGSPAHSPEFFGETQIVDVRVDVQTLQGNHYSEEDFNDRTQYSQSDEASVKLLKASQHMLKKSIQIIEENLTKQQINNPSQELLTNLQKTALSSPGQQDESSVMLRTYTTANNSDFSVDNVSSNQTTEQQTGLSGDTWKRSQQLTKNTAEQMSLQDLERQDKRALNLMENVHGSLHQQKPLESTNVSDQSPQGSKKHQPETRHLLLTLHIDGVSHPLLKGASNIGEKMTNSKGGPILTYPSAQRKFGSYSVDHADSLTEDIRKADATSEGLSAELTKRSFHLSTEPIDESPPVTIGTDIRTLPREGKHYSVEGLDERTSYSRPVDTLQHIIYTVKLTKEALPMQPEDSSPELLTNSQKTSVKSPSQPDEVSRLHATDGNQDFNINNVSSNQSSEQKTGLSGDTWKGSQETKNSPEQLSLQSLATKKLVLHLIEQTDGLPNQPVEKPLDSTNVPDESRQKSVKYQHGRTKYLLLKVYVDGVPQSSSGSLFNIGETTTNYEEEPNQTSHRSAQVKSDDIMEESATFEGSSAEEQKGSFGHSTEQNVQSPHIELKFYTHKLSSSSAGKKEPNPLKSLSEMTQQSASDEDAMQSESSEESLKQPIQGKHDSRKHSNGAPKYLSMDVYLDGSLLTSVHADELPQYVDGDTMNIAKSPKKAGESSSQSFVPQDHPLGQLIKVSDKSGPDLFLEVDFEELSSIVDASRNIAHNALDQPPSSSSFPMESPRESGKRTVEEPLESLDHTFEHPGDHLNHPKQSHPEIILNFVVQLNLGGESGESRNQNKKSPDPLEFSPSRQTTTPPKSLGESTKWYMEEVFNLPSRQPNDHSETSTYGRKLSLGF
ncbi:mucin-12-like [Liolophura sinensis]|uniref:mucin-12-like n=1 Tax=Liolophura sinensis TaxID=3198878 RepID=UPI0031589E01